MEITFCQNQCFFSNINLIKNTKKVTGTKEEKFALQMFNNSFSKIFEFCSKRQSDSEGVANMDDDVVKSDTVNNKQIILQEEKVLLASPPGPDVNGKLTCLAFSLTPHSYPRHGPNCLPTCPRVVKPILSNQPLSN